MVERQGGADTKCSELNGQATWPLDSYRALHSHIGHVALLFDLQPAVNQSGGGS